MAIARKSSVVPTADNINEAHRLAETNSKFAIEQAILCGRLLLAKQKQLDRGKFDEWLEEWCSFSRRTAYLYMKAANRTSKAPQISAIRHLFPSAKKPKKPTISAESTATSCNALHDSTPAASREKPDAVLATPETSIAQPAAPDFDFTDYEPDDDEAYRRNIENVMAADDKLAAMRAALSQAHRELAAMKASRDHYQNQAGEAVRLVKARDREIDKLRRELKQAKEAV